MKVFLCSFKSICLLGVLRVLTFNIMLLCAENVVSCAKIVAMVNCLYVADAGREEFTDVFFLI